MLDRANMVLDRRLKKLGAGVSSSTAALAHPRSLVPGALGDERGAKSEEFRATIEAMFLMAAVDGEVSAEEMSQLSASIQATVDLHVSEDVLVSRVLGELADKLARDGWHARLEAVAARLRTDDARLFAFRLAAGVAFVDDHVAHAEAAALDALAGRLGLTPDESQGILREVHDELFGP